MGQRCGLKEVIRVISEMMGVEESKITDTSVLKSGMTNQSYLFALHGKKYILRIPGEGTKNLINRSQEADVYGILRESGICDTIVCLDSQSGCKITEYWEGARVCNPADSLDVKKCMDKLCQFHNLKLQVAHKFDLFEKILFYESLWGDTPSRYEDYRQIKQGIFSLQPYINTYREISVLSHIDAVPDNFLFVGNDIRLIDWEYAGMQDPHVDLAMFCIYSFYNKKQIDEVIDLYFKGKCRYLVRIKIYCYIAVCGLLWSCWCEYKKQCGVEFGEYALRQYQYAVEYSGIAKEEIKRIDRSGYVSG